MRSRGAYTVTSADESCDSIKRNETICRSRLEMAVITSIPAQP